MGGKACPVRHIMFQYNFRSLLVCLFNGDRQKSSGHYWFVFSMVTGRKVPVVSGLSIQMTGEETPGSL